MLPAPAYLFIVARDCRVLRGPEELLGQKVYASPLIGDIYHFCYLTKTALRAWSNVDVFQLLNYGISVGLLAYDEDVVSRNPEAELFMLKPVRYVGYDPERVTPRSAQGVSGECSSFKFSYCNESRVFVVYGKLIPLVGNVLEHPFPIDVGHLRLSGEKLEELPIKLYVYSFFETSVLVGIVS